MFDNSDLPNGGVQFTISHEVITFLRWLTENNPEELKELTKKALHGGLLMQLQESDKNIEEDETHASILDFFSIIELVMHEAVEEYALNQAQQTKLQNTIDHIDGTFCDNNTVKASLENVTTSHASNPEKSPKELLFIEILKQWRPHNSQLMN